MELGEVISLVVAALFVGGLGILIKHFGRVELIAGYDPERVTDEEGLATFIGTNALYVAGLLLLVALVNYTEPMGGQLASLSGPLLIAGTLALAGRMVIGAQRYEQSAES
ncbi:DUF3784 domain-containing protein [Natronolimnobius sp. AArcel1]|uniref:DUF3784 domain-containing protein n=1 Tax=Natronolimnobius sp. AArcel1 TaxID=1679093 RepID=UPI0013EC19D0|nr:DUF3784 domain-containing protein [Natronolimnobius sp. AArcel1]NGM67650.1 DUF3784 domain-containing protein [Natronolimnobius sp. AArcel1]